jgi:hypothetical protein
MFPLLTSCNEFTRTPMEAPPDNSIATAAYKGCTRSKYMHRTHTKVQLKNGVLTKGSGN